jgi:hypothetical protein
MAEPYNPFKKDSDKKAIMPKQTSRQAFIPEEKQDEEEIVWINKGTPGQRQFDKAIVVFNMTQKNFSDFTPYDPFIEKVRNKADAAVTIGDMCVYVSTDELDFRPDHISDLFTMNPDDVIIGCKSRKLLATILGSRKVSEIELIGCGISEKAAKAFIPKGTKDHPITILDVDSELLVEEIPEAQ